MSRTTNNTNNIKSSRKFSLLLTVTALFLVLSITIAAWFATVNSTEIGFNTGDVTSGIKIRVAAVPTYDENGNKIANLSESNREYSEKVYDDSEEILIDDKTLVTSQTLNVNFTFGLIDNLLAIRADNITYLEVEVPEGSNTLLFDLHYNKEAYERELVKSVDTTTNVETVTNREDLHAVLFKMGTNQWNSVDGFAEIDAFRKIETEGSKLCFLQYSYAVSATRIEDPSKIAELNFGLINEQGEVDSSAVRYFNEFRDEKVHLNGARYVYIKVTPNFAAIGLSGIMDALAYFNVEAEFEAFRMDSTT